MKNREYTDFEKINFYFCHNKKRINFKPFTMSCAVFNKINRYKNNMFVSYK